MLAESFLHPPERTNKHAVHPQPRPRDRVLVYTAAYTGMRAGELLALTRCQTSTCSAASSMCGGR